MSYGLSQPDDELLEIIRAEFNAQPREERLRTGRFMDFEAAIELCRERDHALAAVERIEARIRAVLNAARRKESA